ncbi:hypothetical protein QR680_002499 [Steinernema hermaphroditum]|uniref:Potassium channel domain-containing protein n=1 Tax=Steinernema hermaphroditum TaxID=289476 RepID=A0AA39LI83_9BILA|nr:hypothetical protein QR680_002499 [Steinernema hermaphroditum]
MEDGEVPKLSEPTPPSRRKLTIGRFAKIALPHVGLYLFLFLFLLGGAWAFAKIEDGEDRRKQAEKLERIKEVYQRIRDASEGLCPAAAKSNRFDEQIYSSLSKLSSFMEGRPFQVTNLESINKDLISPRWDKMSAILYSLSILTTTGYAAASPQTGGGQLFAIAYGLVGIPLMVLAAVDIGRFLSDVVLFLYTKNLRAWKRLTDMLGFTAKKQQMMELVEIKAIKPQRRRSRRRLSRRKRRGFGRSRRQKEADPNAKRLPLSVNAAILLLFCCLGGFVYLAAGGNQKSFIEAFFITFNLVANLTMSEMPNDLSHALTLIYIIMFVTCGLAVLSMCADLAASELKWLFLKIHYFGRKINWKRKVRKTPEVHEQLEVEVKELLKIIEQIRRKYPEKDKITSSDILQYMHDLRGDRPSWVCITHHRRDTIAFMPQSIETLRFADEMDQDEQHSHRSISRSEEARV